MTKKKILIMCMLGFLTFTSMDVFASNTFKAEETEYPIQMIVENPTVTVNEETSISLKIRQRMNIEKLQLSIPENMVLDLDKTKKNNEKSLLAVTYDEEKQQMILAAGDSGEILEQEYELILIAKDKGLSTLQIKNLNNLVVSNELLITLISAESQSSVLETSRSEPVTATTDRSFLEHSKHGLLNEDGQYVSGQPLSFAEATVILAPVEGTSGPTTMAFDQIDSSGYKNSSGQLELNKDYRIDNYAVFRGQPVDIMLNFSKPDDAAITPTVSLSLAINAFFPNLPPTLNLVLDKRIIGESVDFSITAVKPGTEEKINAPIFLGANLGTNANKGEIEYSESQINGLFAEEKNASSLFFGNGAAGMTEFRLGTGTSGYTGIHMLINAQNGLNGRFRTLRASRWGGGIITNDAFSIVQLPFSDPEFYGLTEDDEDTARYMFEMELPKQFSKEKYPEDLVIDIDLNSISKKVDTSEIKIIDKNSKDDITSYFELLMDESGLKARIDRSNLSEISSFNVIQFQIEGLVDLTHPDLMSYFNAKTGYLTIPATANVNFSEEIFSAEAEVKLRKPFADGVKQTVAIDSSTEDLNPEAVIRNIWSPIENDSIQVVGFKDKMVFSELGETEIIVIIRSGTTGLESEICVPVVVVTGELKFSSRPNQISFGTIPIQSEEKEYFATDFDEDLTVGDTRYKKDWKVTVQLIGGLSLEGSNAILNDVMYYTNTDGEKIALSVNPTSIAGVTQNTEQSTVISDSWKSGQYGISVKPRQGQMKSGKYSVLLVWVLEDTP